MMKSYSAITADDMFDQAQTLLNSPISRGLEAGLKWWGRELRHVWSQIESRLPLSSEETETVLFTQSVEGEAPLPLVSRDEGGWVKLASALLAGSSEDRPLSVVIDDSICLIRSVSCPDVSVADVSSIVDLEVAAATPFRQTNAVWSWRRTGGRTVEIVILKTSVIEQIEALAAGAGLMLQEISPRAAASQPSIPFKRYETPALRNRRLVRKLNVALAALLLSGGAAVYGISIYQKSEALAGLNAEVQEKTKAARQLREDLNAREQAAEASRKIGGLKNARTSVVENWARVTQLLPQNVWLSELTLEKDGGRMVGFAGNAAGLIQVLEDDPAIRDVQFVTSVQIDPLSKAERFDIRYLTEMP